MLYIYNWGDGVKCTDLVVKKYMSSDTALYVSGNVIFSSTEEKMTLLLLADPDIDYLITQYQGEYNDSLVWTISRKDDWTGLDCKNDYLDQNNDKTSLNKMSEMIELLRG